jgi:hypothetical protein
MNRVLLLSALLLGLLPLTAGAQVAYSEDFEGEFPGPGQPSFLWWLGGGVGGGTDPFNPTFPSEISEDGLGEFQQAWKISFDTTTTTDWYWFGGAGAALYSGPEFPAAGVFEGGNNPANWVYSVDARAVGALGDVAAVAEFTFYDPDYEAIYGIDTNGDGDLLDGANTWKSSFPILDNDGDPDGFTSNSFRLNSGAAPTTEVTGDIPRFDNTGTWIIGFFGGGGEYQFGVNSLTIDNISIEYSELPAVTGDYNSDGLVDAADYTVWRANLGELVTLPNEGEGVTPGEVTSQDYDVWVANYGALAGKPAIAASVPEPVGVTLTFVAALAAFGASRARRPL